MQEVSENFAGDALAILGSQDQVREMFEIYFRTTHSRLPVVSEERLLHGFAGIFTPTASSLMALSLCMRLLLDCSSSSSDMAMASTPYILAKSIITFVEASHGPNLDTIQSQLLIAFYEIGHGIFPAASLTIALCAKAARNIGITKRLFSKDNSRRDSAAEENLRTWWAIHNLDRFVLR